jgi:hypothetical protein
VGGWVTERERERDDDAALPPAVLMCHRAGAGGFSWVKRGAFHTIDLEPTHSFTLWKPLWDSIALERVDAACDPTRTADVAAVVRVLLGARCVVAH